MSSWLSTYLRSSIGAKQLMGVTGLGLVGFVFIHMIGNLQIFLGQDTFNAYPEKLRSVGLLLWIARAGLFVLFVAHIGAGLRLWFLNVKARPTAYKSFRPRVATFYGRYMGMLGMVILAYLVYHLLHFTYGLILPEYAHMVAPNEKHDLFGYVVASFQHIPTSVVYLVANTLLCLHLLHGIPSLFQSAGLRHPRYNQLIDRLALGLVTLIFVGNTAIPLAVLLGVVS